MANSLLMPAIAMIVGTTLLSLQIYIMIRINHGASRNRQQQVRRPSGSGARGSIRYSAGAAPSRILTRNDTDDEPARAAQRLVDSGGMRRLSRNRAGHLGGLRGPRAGSRSGADVRSIAGLAAPDGQELGGVTPPPRQVASILPSAASVL